MSLETGLFVALVFALAGCVKGVVGMGLPVLAMGALALVMPPVQAASLLVLPSLVTNVWQLLAGPALAQVLRRLAPMMLCVCGGTALGIGLMTGTGSRWPALLLGTVLAGYGVLALAAPRLAVPQRHERWLGPGVGLCTGVLTGATGIFAVPAVPYLGALGLSKEELIQALGLSFTVSTLALALALLATGSYAKGLMLGSLLAVLPALAGMFLGQMLRERLNPPVFRLWFLRAMVVMGLLMVLRAL